MNQEENRKRNHKVFYGFYDNRWTDNLHPVIRLRGKYLSKFGFNVGDAIEVLVDMGQITIKKVKPP